MNFLFCFFLKLSFAGALVGISISPIAADVIYKKTEANGVPVFSDRHQRGMESVTVSAVNSIKPLKSGNEGRLKAPIKESEISYRIAFNSPVQNQTYRNGETVPVLLEVNPPLGLTSGHKVDILLNGVVHVRQNAMLNFNISELERGSHRLEALVTNIANEEIARSEVITFFVHKTSLISGSRLIK